jgi:hypothetical protein
MFEIVEIKKLDRPGRRLKGLATIRLHCPWGDIDLLNWRIIKQDSGRWYIQIPSTTWKSLDDDQIHFQELIRMPRELQQKIELEILTRWHKEVDNGSNDAKQ